MQATQEPSSSASTVRTVFDRPETRDPEVPDWSALDLPAAWPDEALLRNPRHVLRLIRHVFGQPAGVELPTSLPGRERIPQYALQEFHRVPNGFYSHRMARGYSRWFDATMLHTVSHARRVLAELTRSPGSPGSRSSPGSPSSPGSSAADLDRFPSSVLDVGCADGKLAQAFVRAGAHDVWGLDLSPYLLKLGSSLHPAVKFVHGAAERMPFPDARFDAVGACFFFHELPLIPAHEALRECRRVLRPGGKLVICEPAPEQFERNATLRNIRIGGLQALYFQRLAHLAFEPFVELWHQRDYASWFESAGLRLAEDRRDFPCRMFVAERLCS